MRLLHASVKDSWTCMSIELFSQVIEGLENHFYSLIGIHLCCLSKIHHLWGFHWIFVIVRSSEICLPHCSSTKPIETKVVLLGFFECLIKNLLVSLQKSFDSMIQSMLHMHQVVLDIACCILLNVVHQ